MQLQYDPATDELRIVLRHGSVERCEEDIAGVVKDYAGDGALLGLCIKQASQAVDDPRCVDVAVSGRTVRGMRMY